MLPTEDGNLAGQGMSRDVTGPMTVVKEFMVGIVGHPFMTVLMLQHGSGLQKPPVQPKEKA